MFNLFKKNKKPKKVKDNANNSYIEAQDFIQNAQQFIINENELIRNQNKFYKTIVIISLLISLLSVLAVIFLTPLKKVEPYIVKVDKSTGKTDIVTMLDKQMKSYGDVTDKYNISQYIQYRESYDWETVDTTYKATLLMSNENVQTEYKKLYGTSNTISPINAFKDRFRIIVNVESINFIGDIAQVRFTKTKIPTSNIMQEEKAIKNEYIASLTYIYENAPITEKERLVNPLGFTVKSYSINKVGN